MHNGSAQPRQKYLDQNVILSKFGGKTEGEASGSDDNPRILRASGEKYNDELTAENLVVNEAENELKISNVTKKGKDKVKAQ